MGPVCSHSACLWLSLSLYPVFNSMTNCSVSVISVFWTDSLTAMFSFITHCSFSFCHSTYVYYIGFWGSRSSWSLRKLTGSGTSGGWWTLPAGLHVLRSLNLTFSPLRSQPIFPLIFTSFFSLSLVNCSVCVPSTCEVAIYSPFLASFPSVGSRPYAALPFLFFVCLLYLTG